MSRLKPIDLPLPDPTRRTRCFGILWLLRCSSLVSSSTATASGILIQLQIGDLKSVQKALCIQYQMDDGSHYQDVCPQCCGKQRPTR